MPEDRQRRYPAPVANEDTPPAAPIDEPGFVPQPQYRPGQPPARKPIEAEDRGREIGRRFAEMGWPTLARTEPDYVHMLAPVSAWMGQTPPQGWAPPAHENVPPPELSGLDTAAMLDVLDKVDKGQALAPREEEILETILSLPLQPVRKGEFGDDLNKKLRKIGWYANAAEDYTGQSVGDHAVRNSEKYREWQLTSEGTHFLAGVEDRDLQVAQEKALVEALTTPTRPLTFQEYLNVVRVGGVPGRVSAPGLPPVPTRGQLDYTETEWLSYQIYLRQNWLRNFSRDTLPEGYEDEGAWQEAYDRQLTELNELGMEQLRQAGVDPALWNNGFGPAWVTDVLGVDFMAMTPADRRFIMAELKARVPASSWAALGIDESDLSVANTYRLYSAIQNRTSDVGRAFEEVAVYRMENRFVGNRGSTAIPSAFWNQMYADAGGSARAGGQLEPILSAFIDRGVDWQLGWAAMRNLTNNWRNADGVVQLANDVADALATEYRNRNNWTLALIATQFGPEMADMIEQYGSIPSQAYSAIAPVLDTVIAEAERYGYWDPRMRFEVNSLLQRDQGVTLPDPLAIKQSVTDLWESHLGMSPSSSVVGSIVSSVNQGIMEQYRRDNPFRQDWSQVRVTVPGRVANPAQGGGIVFPVGGSDVSYHAGFLDPRTGHRHAGIDIMAPFGAPVMAPVSGVWRSRPDNGNAGGNRGTLIGDDGRYYYLAHLSGFAITNGRVQAGQTLGFVGNTGNARDTAPHLHFEISANGQFGNTWDPVGAGRIDPYHELRSAQNLPWDGAVPLDPMVVTSVDPNAVARQALESDPAYQYRFENRPKGTDPLAYASAYRQFYTNLTGLAPDEQAVTVGMRDNNPATTAGYALGSGAIDDSSVLRGRLWEIVNVLNRVAS